MFSKEDIKNRWSEYCAEQISEGKDVPELDYHWQV